MSDDDEKKIKVVKGNGDLNISPVYDHIKMNRTTPREKKKNVIIPKRSNKYKK